MFYEVIPEGRLEALTYDFMPPEDDDDFSSNSLLPGQIVMVPVGRRTVPGVVVKKVVQPNFKTKSILKVLYSKPLPAHLLAAVKFVHEYYLVPSGQAVSLMLPRGVQKKRQKTEHLFGDASLGGSCRRMLPPPSLEARAGDPQATSPAHANHPGTSAVRLNTAQKRP